MEETIVKGPGKFPPEWAADWGHDTFGYFAALVVKGVRQCFRWLDPGAFMMGSPENEPERDDDERHHRVVLTKGFWLADTTCTQGLWQAVMGENPSDFQGANRPVDSVSWEDAMAFIERLNNLGPDLDFCLPTEAQWEYACRAGTPTPFSFGENITPDQVNYDGNFPYAGGKEGAYRKETVDVASLPPNPWGLYEMHGNVLEWCADWFGDYPQGEVVDPTGPSSGEFRVLRGGSWSRFGRFVRSAGRLGCEPGYRYHDAGFRLSRGQNSRNKQGQKVGPVTRSGSGGRPDRRRKKG